MTIDFLLCLWTSRPKVNFSTPSHSSSWLPIIIKSYNDHHHYHHNHFGTIYHKSPACGLFVQRLTSHPPSPWNCNGYDDQERDNIYMTSLTVAMIMTILRETLMLLIVALVITITRKTWISLIWYDFEGLVGDVRGSAVVMDMMMGFLMLTTHIDGGCDHDD